MSLVKLDPEKNFKWPAYPPTPALSEADNSTLRIVLQLSYKELIDKTLADFNLPACSGEIRMLTTLFYGGQTYINGSPIFGTYTKTGFDSRLEKSTLSEELKEEIEYMYITLVAGAGVTLPDDIKTIKERFRQCAPNNLFVVRLTTSPLHELKQGVKHISHANILVIAKNRGTVYWIEPKTTVNPKYESLMISSIKTLVTDIGMPDPTVINPVEVCPQAIANDTNCMFWAYVIFMLILLNPQERDHNVLIKNFMEKYPTKEALGGYINGLKTTMLPIAVSYGAGRKRTIRRRHHKKRKTYRRK
jgi:hypothetical protein